MERSTIFHRKIHYFYGNFQLQTVSSPEGIQATKHCYNMGHSMSPFFTSPNHDRYFWSTRWLLFQVMSNIPKMGQLPTPDICRNHVEVSENGWVPPVLILFRISHMKKTIEHLLGVPPENRKQLHNKCSPLSWSYNSNNQGFQDIYHLPSQEPIY